MQLFPGAGRGEVDGGEEASGPVRGVFSTCRGERECEKGFRGHRPVVVSEGELPDVGGVSSTKPDQGGVGESAALIGGGVLEAWHRCVLASQRRGAHGAITLCGAWDRSGVTSPLIIVPPPCIRTDAEGPIVSLDPDAVYP